jgi:hypothetical protein
MLAIYKGLCCKLLQTQHRAEASTDISSPFIRERDKVLEFKPAYKMIPNGSTPNRVYHPTRNAFDYANTTRRSFPSKESGGGIRGTWHGCSGSPISCTLDFISRVFIDLKVSLLHIRDPDTRL